MGDEPPEEEVVLDPLLLQARRGLALHSAVTGVVCVLLIALNVARAPELIWWPFRVVGMLLGLGVPWWYGYDRLLERLRHRQDGGKRLTKGCKGVGDRAGAAGQCAPA